MVLTFEPIIFDDRKKLTYEVQDKIMVAGDAQRLQQLLSILLDNAVKYCPAGGVITINLKETDKKNALLTVYNDGEPIPKEESPKYFNGFTALINQETPMAVLDWACHCGEYCERTQEEKYGWRETTKMVTVF
jgi:K+-sensing histidine kinase KdpD